MDGEGFPVSLFQSLFVTVPGVFSLPAGSLSALVYQHSVIPLALPCKLVIPSRGRKCSLMLSSQNGARAEAIQGAPLPVFFLRGNQLPINYQIILKSTLAVKKKNLTLNSQNRPYSQNEDSHTRIISGYMKELLVSGDHFCSSSLTH